MTFDLISAEYGWTDEQILDLPVRRLLPITQSIQFRKAAVTHQRRSELQWQTRALTSFASAFGGSEKRNQILFDLAKTISPFPSPKVKEDDIPFDPEAEPDYSKMKLRETSNALGILKTATRPRP